MTPVEIEAMDMLIGSFIFRVGLENSFPFITFLNNENDQYITLRIDSEFQVTMPPQVPSTLDHEYRESIALLSLDSEEFETINCAEDGNLTIKFKSGRYIDVSGMPKELEVFEPWTLFNQESKKQIICQRGGDYAVFKGN